MSGFSEFGNTVVDRGIKIRQGFPVKSTLVRKKHENSPLDPSTAYRQFPNGRLSALIVERAIDHTNDGRPATSAAQLPMAYPRAGVAPLRNVGVYPGLVAHLVRDEGGAAFKSSHSDQHLADLLLKSATTCATTCPGRRDGRCRCSPPDRSYRRNTAAGQPGLPSSLVQHGAFAPS